MSSVAKFMPIILTVVGAIGAAVLNPAFFAAHPVVVASLGSLAAILHAALPSVFKS